MAKTVNKDTELANNVTAGDINKAATEIVSGKDYDKMNSSEKKQAAKDLAEKMAGLNANLMAVAGSDKQVLAQTNGQAFLNQLVLKVLDMKLKNYELPKQFGFLKELKTQRIRGNTYEFFTNLARGCSVYNANEYIPNAQTELTIETQNVSFYDPKTKGLQPFAVRQIEGTTTGYTYGGSFQYRNTVTLSPQT